jgi:hypothetical protein
MLLVTQNSTDPFNVYFGVSGLTVTATLSKNGGAFNSVSPTITDRSNGYYSIAPISAHRDTIGENAWLFAASGQTSVPRVEQVGRTDFGLVAAGAPSGVEISDQIAIDIREYDGTNWEGALTTIQDGLATAAGVTAAKDEVIEAVEGIEVGTGTGARPVTPTVRVSGSPLEGATIRFTLGAETYSGTTNSSGQVTFNLDDGTYTVSISKPGYSFAGTTLVVDGDESPIYTVTANSITTPTDPALATLVVKCVDEAGAIEPGAVVYVRLTGIPAGSTGLSFDGISQEATANSEGNAVLTIVKLAKYQIRRGETQQWKPFTAGSGDSQTIESFIGVDPVVV